MQWNRERYSQREAGAAMTHETMIPLGHKTLRLRDLSPEKSSSFSPNLYRWMKRRAHFYRDGGVAEGVYRVKPGTAAAEHFGAGTLMIGHPFNGHPGDTDFSGARLMQALCIGGKALNWCYSNMAPDLELVEGFWDRYLQVGRCAIDPSHQTHFSGGERFIVNGNVRKCLWCGQQQHQVVTPRTVLDEAWEAF